MLSSRKRHTSSKRDWSSDVCSSDLPKIFLFDEPLSNLDAKLLTDMRAEIKKLHQREKTATVYVTHDQIEAMTLATKIVEIGRASCRERAEISGVGVDE